MHELSTIMFFLIPVAILSYLYISMALALKGSIRKGSLAGVGSMIAVKGGGGGGNGSEVTAATAPAAMTVVSSSAVHGGSSSSSRKQIIRMLGN